MKNLLIVILLVIVAFLIQLRFEEKSAQKDYMNVINVEKKYVEEDLSILFNLEDYEECKNTFDSIRNDSYNLDFAFTFEYRVIPVKCTEDTLEMILLDDYNIFHCINGECNIFYIDSLVKFIVDPSPHPIYQ
ncbi:hypothetical protein [Flammeovirga aprica]|uniref:Uncharacterized protein n=1 Tax=Flammeovirga aprica JL-4 TaxID=694437 RepID=A0A7X9RZM1_9BACT|nr:hypothetical protein [Flammeovirga aprica]NME71542.1 hypothetical protein [Flammeovirga aprica JL-4]